MLFKSVKKYSYVLLLIAALAAINSCTKRVQELSVVEKDHTINSLFKPSASIQELMVSVIDPNIDAIWNSVSTVSTYHGVIETRPQTEEEWQRLRGHAVTLREVYNLLVIPGRHVAEKNATTSSGGGELHAEQIQALIASQWTEFVLQAAQLQAASDQVIKAIDARNVAALEEAGGLVEHACEGCHSKFWYPGDKHPTQ